MLRAKRNVDGRLQRLFGGQKTLGGDTDDGVVASVEANGRPENRVVGPESVAPEGVRNDGDERRAGAHLVGGKPAAERQADAEHIEIVGGDGRAHHHRRYFVVGEIELGVEAESRDVLERFDFGPGVGEIRPGDRPAGATEQRHQAVLCFHVRERAEEQRVDESADRRQRGDPERQRKDGHRREARRLRQVANPVGKVLRDDRRDPSNEASAWRRLLGLTGPAGAPRRRGPGPLEAPAHGACPDTHRLPPVPKARPQRRAGTA